MQKVITLVVIVAITIVFSVSTSMAVDKRQGGKRIGPVSPPPDSPRTKDVPIKIPPRGQKGDMKIGPVSPPPDSPQTK